MNDEEIEKAKTLAREKLVHLSALMASKDFRWFLEVCLGGFIAETEEKAFDLSLSPQQRDIACHVRVELLKIRDWAKEEAAICRQQIS